MVTEGSRRPTTVALRVATGVALFVAAHLLWGLFTILFGLFGFRFAMSTSHPALAEVAAQQWSSLVLPFLPGALAAGFVIGILQMRLLSSLRAVVAGAVAAPLAFTVTLAAALALQPPSGGYAAEQGMDALLYILVPLIGLTASPIWAVAAFLAARVIRKRHDCAANTSVQRTSGPPADLT